MKEILVKPLITEKGMDLASQSKYVFEIGKKSNKKEIRDAISKMYKVDVIKVNIVQKKPKTRRIGREKGLKPGRKVAIITLKGDQKIELFEEVK